MILIAGILVGIQTIPQLADFDTKGCNMDGEYVTNPPNLHTQSTCAAETDHEYRVIRKSSAQQTTTEIFYWVNEVILAIFTIECAIKMIGEIPKPRFRARAVGFRARAGNTHKHDARALPVAPRLAQLLPLELEHVRLRVRGLVVRGEFDWISFNPTVLRLLRLLRVLKMVKRFPQLQVIVNALIMGLGSIAYIALILFFFFYLFAIIGVNEFGDNDPWHFGSLHIAMLTLYRCSTLEDWTDVMYINMYGCDRWSHHTGGFEHLCVAPVAQGYTAALFFICFVILGALVLLTLFVGVVTTGMDEASEAQNYEIKMAKKIAEIAKAEEIAENVVENYCQVFAMLDLDGGGSIEEEELRLGLRQIGREPSDTELTALLLTVDEDGSGAIDMAEFAQFMVNMKKKSHERKEMLRSGVKKVMQMSKITARSAHPSRPRPRRSPASSSSA